MEKQLKIPSKIESIKAVEKWIDEISTELEITKTIYGNVLISVVEAVNNAILHGNKQDESKSVELNLNVEEKELNISVKDNGPGFDHNSIPDPTSPSNLESLNGRGVFLMKSLTDELEYCENGTCVKLKFNI